MGLPSIPLPTDVVMVAGVEVPIRGLSRAQVLRFATMTGDPDGAENWLIACGCGVSEAEAREWRDSIPADGDIDELVKRIASLSGLSEGAQKSG